MTRLVRRPTLGWTFEMYRLASPTLLPRLRNSCATDAMAALVGPMWERSLTAFLSALCFTEFFVWGEALNWSTRDSISFRIDAIVSSCCIESE
jgi:hypothetical protein